MLGICAILRAKSHIAAHGLKSDGHLLIDRHCAPYIYIRRNLHLKKFQFNTKEIRHHANRRVQTCGESSAKNVTRCGGIVYTADSLMDAHW